MGLGKHDDLVGVVGEVEVCIPAEVSAAHDVAVHGELHSGVPHVADVVIVACETVGNRNGHIVEHVRSQTVEVLRGTGEATSEEFEVDTGIDIGVGLPCDVLVSDGRSLDGDISVGVGDGVHVGVEVVADVVVTLRSDGCLDLEHSQP